MTVEPHQTIALALSPPLERGFIVPVLPPVDLFPATRYTYDELVAAYNQTRVDYIVPMPMNAQRLARYVHNYSVALEHSVVAVDNGDILGLSMLGVRGAHTWITRLGVLPAKRKRGTGQILMEAHLARSQQLGAQDIWLEVIKDNTPAQTLFCKLGFEETRELLVLRRPPNAALPPAPEYTVTFLDCQEALTLLAQRRDAPNWLNQTPSLLNAGNLEALRVELADGSWGWVAFEHVLYQLGRLVIHPETGDFEAVIHALLHALHTRHPSHDTRYENLPISDPRWPMLQTCGYLVSFRRIEMRLDL